MSFKMRTTKPEKGNPYYTRKVSGGYSNAIQGNPTDRDCDVLSNCVGYAYGRFNEIGNWGCCKYLASVNAENFIQYKGSCGVGETPKLGACMVWQKGATLSGSDGAGHVAIVEKVISPTEVMTSESGWGCSAFWTQTRKKGSNGNWGAGTGYKFLGFIYNPAVKDSDTPVEVKPTEEKVNEYSVRVTISDLRIRTGPGTNYLANGFVAPGVYVIAAESNGQGAKRWGKLKNGAGWVSLDYTTKVESASAPTTIKVGSKVNIVGSDATWYNGKNIPAWVRSKSWIVASINNDRVVIDKSVDGSNSIMSPINIKFLKLV